MKQGKMMKVLVTGAGGFLGRYVVQALVTAGLEVRAVVRPSAKFGPVKWNGAVEVLRLDLCKDCLEAAFADVDVLVHLAAQMRGDDRQRVDGTVIGTRRLLEAMQQSQTRRLVLAGSFSVYDWHKAAGELTEDSSLETKPRLRDGYARAKLEQEHMVREMSRRSAWPLTVLRIASLWGSEAPLPYDVGHRAGPLLLVVGPLSRLRLVHVENAAVAFVRAVETAHQGERILNVCDDEPLTAWQYASQYVRRSNSRAVRVPVPYMAGWLMAWTASGLHRAVLLGRGRLPGLLKPRCFEARFKSISCSNRALRAQLSYQPVLDLEEAIQRTWPTFTEHGKHAKQARYG